MMIRTLILLVALALSGCVATPGSQPRGQLQLVDLTDDFSRHWELTKQFPDAERVAEFKRAFAAILPGFYSHERMGLPTAERYDQHLLKYLNKFPEERPGIEDVSRRFSGMLEPAQRSFEAEFGPMEGYPPIYLVHSLNEFDGGTRNLAEGVRLLFGADMIHRLYGDKKVQPFFHHELFHLFHNRTFPECDPIWCALWTEGLATYVATKLNPGATEDELLLTWPEPLRPAVERDRRLAVCTMLSKLGSTNADDYKAMFSNGPIGGPLPPRFGYYLGYLVAAEAGKTRSLRELAQIGKADVRPLVEASLRSLADCPA